MNLYNILGGICLISVLTVGGITTFEMTQGGVYYVDVILRAIIVVGGTMSSITLLCKEDKIPLTDIIDGNAEC